jgi:hypothetical protein
MPILYRRIVVLFLFFGTCLFPSGSFSQQGDDAEKVRLKQRVEQYWNAWVQGKWDSALEVVREKDRAFFMGKPKTTILSYTIESIVLDKDKTKATVSVTAKKMIRRFPHPVDWQVENTWELTNGTWVIAFEDRSRESYLNIFRSDAAAAAPNAGPAGKISSRIQVPGAVLDMLNISDTVDAPLEATHNFGEIHAGQSVEYKFKFQNLAKTAVQIEGTESDCQCIAATVTPLGGTSEKKTFYTQEQGEVTVKLNSKGMNGKVQQSARLRLSGRSTPMTLKLTGYVSENFKVVPGVADFGVVPRSSKPSQSEPKSIELILYNNSTDRVKINTIAKSSDVIDAQVGKYDLAPYDRTSVKVILKPGSKPLPKKLDASVSITTSLEREPTITIPVKASSN